MATETNNLKLIRPAGSDFYDIEDFNQNADKIDALAGEGYSGETVKGNADAIETLQSDIADLQGEVDTKATKAVPAAAGNLASLAADGDLLDTGVNKYELLNLRGGNNLASGTDIFTLAPGTYWSPSAAITQSLINAPSNRGIVVAMIVISVINGHQNDNTWLCAHFIQGLRTWFAYRESNGWSGWRENQYVYTTLDAMGLTDADFSPTDFAGNILKMINATAGTSLINLHYQNSGVSNIYLSPNLSESTKAYLGITTTDYVIEIIRTINSVLPNKIYITPNGVGTMQPLYYCTYDNVLSAPAILNAGNRQNLWRNSDFRNPVKQRPETTFTGQSGYTIDGLLIPYRSDDGNSLVSVTVHDGYITISNAGSTEIVGYAASYIENWQDLKGKTVTVSIIDTDGILYSATGAFPAVWPSVNFNLTTNTDWGYIRVQYIPTRPIVWVVIGIRPGQSKSFLRGKLEENPFSTLSYDPPQNYGRTERESLRYALKLNAYASNVRMARYSANTVNFWINTPVPLRGFPTIINPENLTVSNLDGSGTGGGWSWVADQMDATGVRLTGTKTAHGLTDGLLSCGPGYVLLDAENY